MTVPLACSLQATESLFSIPRVLEPCQNEIKIKVDTTGVQFCLPQNELRPFNTWIASLSKYVSIYQVLCM